MSSLGSTEVPVLIVGAGPTGLFLALTLLRSEVHVRIIEKDLDFHGGSRGAGVQPRTLEIMHFLGILPEAQRLGIPIPLMRSYKASDGREPLATWKSFQDFEQTPNFPIVDPLILSQARHEAILRAELEKYNCRVELGTELLSFSQDESGVTAELAIHQPDGETVHESVRTGFLAGADGAKGVVRKLLNLSFRGTTQDADGIVVCDAIVRGLSHEFWHAWVEKSSIGFWMRSIDPKIDFFNIVILGFKFDLSSLTDAAAVTDLFRMVTGRTDVTVESTQWLSYFKPNMRMVDQFRVGRVFILGDGAHVHSPTGGQGLNASVQDSFNLAWKLALVHKGLAPFSLLDTYDEERLPVIQEMLRMTTALYEKHSSEDDPSTGSVFRGKELFMLGINYRWSSLALDTRSQEVYDVDGEYLRTRAYGGHASSLCAGDRAPDAPALVDPQTGVQVALFDIFDVARHTVLIFAGPEVGVDNVKGVISATTVYPEDTLQTVVLSPNEWACDIKADRVLVDTAHHAFKGYFVNDLGMTVVVVRPDGYVGAVVSTKDEMATYFSNIFVTTRIN